MYGENQLDNIQYCRTLWSFSISW